MFLLGASWLKNIISFLKEIVDARLGCEDTRNSSSEDVSNQSQVWELEEEILLSEDADFLFLGDRLISGAAARDNSGIFALFLDICWTIKQGAYMFWVH